MKTIIKRILAYLFEYSQNRFYTKKISHLLRSFLEKNSKANISPQTIEQHKKLWAPFRKKIDLKWLTFFTSVTGNEFVEYIPETTYYIDIEPRLNNKAFTKAYTDKNFYDIIFDKNIFPNTIVRCIQGVLYTQDYQKMNVKDAGNKISQLTKFVIKPSIDSGGGKAVKVYTKSMDIFMNVVNHKKYTTEEVIHNAGNFFVLQEYIKQHSYFEAFNPSSVNTVRILTYRSVQDERVHCIQSVLRVGKLGEVVDNQASGGIAIGINTNGKLNDHGKDKTGKKYTTLNGNNIIDMPPVPEYSTMCSIAKKIASQFYNARLLGFDFYMDKNSNVKIIEINISNNEINFYQLNNGPLFGEFTNEVISYCANSPVFYCFDFSLNCRK